jgi:hypothetical protein
MRILSDKSAPNGLAAYLREHSGSTAERCGWARWENGDLLSIAEESGYELFLTADKNLRYQQNLAGRKISILVLGQSPWPLVRQHIPAIVAAVDATTPGSFVEVEIPLPPKKPFIRY